MNFILYFRSELLKTKRTSVWYLMFAALLIPLMEFLFDNNNQEGIDQLRTDPWNIFFINGSVPLGIAILPLFVILLCTLIPQIEYRNHAWKQVLSSPRSYLDIFLSKYLAVQLLIICFILAYFLFMLGSLLATHAFKGDLDLFNKNFDAGKIIIHYARIYVSVLAISSMQFYLGMRFRNFILPIAIGFALWITAVMMIADAQWIHADKFPYAYSMLNSFSKNADTVSFVLLSSAVVGIVIFITGFLNFRQRLPKS